MLLRSPPMTPDSADTSLARIQSQPLRLSFCLACSTTRSVSAAKPMTRAGRFAFNVGAGRQNVGFLGQRRGGLADRALLDLLPARRRDPPVGDGGREDRD